MGLVLFFTNVDAFPIRKENITYSPIKVMGGYIFSIEKKDMLDDLGIKYQIKNKDEIEFLPPPEDEILD